jgi:Flp pilus assembly pilin Flp
MRHRHYRPEVAEGQGLVEYALILVLIALAVITLVGAMGGGVVSIYQDRITSSLSTIISS